MGRLGSGPYVWVGQGQECGLVPVFSCIRSLYIDWRMVVVVGWGMSYIPARSPIYIYIYIYIFIHQNMIEITEQKVQQK